MRTVGKILTVTLSLCCASAFSLAQTNDTVSSTTSSTVSSSKTTAADNSGINKRDKHGATLTPQDQPNHAGDRKLLASVRKAVVHDKSLSSSAHNVKILVTGGVVTLRGPVNSEAEKSKIGQIATQVAGVASIDNQLEVKTH